jgi:hypothetical protein
MEILLRDFLTDKMFRLNGLVNLENFTLLLAFYIRDVWGCAFCLAADVIVLPYYYFQHIPPGRRLLGSGVHHRQRVRT